MTLIKLITYHISVLCVDIYRNIKHTNELDNIQAQFTIGDASLKVVIRFKKNLDWFYSLAKRKNILRLKLYT